MTINTTTVLGLWWWWLKIGSDHQIVGVVVECWSGILPSAVLKVHTGLKIYKNVQQKKVKMIWHFFCRSTNTNYSKMINLNQIELAILLFWLIFHHFGEREGDIGGGWRSNGGTHFLLDYCAASSLSWIGRTRSFSWPRDFHE